MYAIEAPGADSVRVGSESLAPLRPGHFAWTVRNAVGRCELRAVHQDATGSAISVEVVSKRFGDPAEQLMFVQKVLRSIDKFHAIFQPSSSTTWSISRQDKLSRTALLAAIVQHGDELTSSLTSVQSDPIFAWKTTDQRVDVATHGDSVTPLAIASADGDWQHAKTKLPPLLKGKLPRHAWGEDTARHTDCLENQLVAGALAVIQQASDSSEFKQALALLSPQERAHANRVLHSVEQARECDTFSRCQRVQDECKARLLVQRNPPYAQVIRWLDHAGENLWSQHPTLSDAARLRDAATLYEYWCFFALSDALCSALDLPMSSYRSLAQGTVVEFGSEYALQYNRETESYSGKLKPDFVLTYQGRPQWVFDAKMRVQRTGASLDPRTDDLHKMHAYRDALGVFAAVCLYPGDQSIFWQTHASAITPFRLTTLLRNELQGIGALAFNP